VQRTVTLSVVLKLLHFELCPGHNSETTRGILFFCPKPILGASPGSPGSFCQSNWMIFVPPFLEMEAIRFPLSILQPVRSHFVSHVAQKVFDLESWNFTGKLLSMWCCAPGGSLVGFFCFVVIALDLVKICNYLFFCFVVIALDLVKICNNQLVSHKAQKYLTYGHETLQECW
jgi:hypothetical protein